MRAKSGYVLDDTPQTVKVRSHEVVTVEFRNQPLGGLRIVKLDSVTRKPLAGVEFRVAYADGSYAVSYTHLATTVYPESDFSNSSIISGGSLIEVPYQPSVTITDLKQKDGSIGKVSIDSVSMSCKVYEGATDCCLLYTSKRQNKKCGLRCGRRIF